MSHADTNKFYWDAHLGRWSRILSDGSEIAMTPCFNRNDSTWEEVENIYHVPFRARNPLGIHSELPKEVLALMQNNLTTGTMLVTYILEEPVYSRLVPATLEYVAHVKGG